MEFQTYKDGYIKSDVVLSIGMLVSNHIQYIEKCMEGLKPLLDNVKSELIILDTVGPEKSDGSIDVCRKYTDKIYRFEWINDFSAARNELIKHSRGEWFMYQDDDEWFDDVTEFIEFFNSPDVHKYNSGCYLTRDYYNNVKDDSRKVENAAISDRLGETYSMGLAARIVRLRANTGFVGKIHEYFNEMFLPRKEFSCFTHHMGYMYQSMEELREKTKRNLTILEEIIKDEGLSPNVCAQKIQALMSIEDLRNEGFKLSVEYTDKFVEMGLETNTCVQWMMVRQVRYFAFDRDGDNLIRQAGVVRGKYHLSHFAALVIACEEAEAIILFSDALKYLDLLKDDIELYFRMFHYLENHPEVRMREVQGEFPDYITPEKYNLFLVYGAQLCNIQKNYNDAWNYWKQVNWEKISEAVKYRRPLMETLKKLSSAEAMKEYINGFNNPAFFEAGRKYISEELKGEMERALKPSPVFLNPATGKPFAVYKDGYIKSDVVLSIGMLVSNHIQYIEKCLEGLKPLLDNVKSELIILDTVGPEKSDGSIDVCRKYTDKIYRFEWINDFSAARNELIKHSRGEWFMYQDDDEWFDDVAEFIEFFNSPDVHKYNSGFYLTKDYHIDGTSSMGIAGRMVRRMPDTALEGRVHESFNHARLPGKQFNCFTHHQGYVYETDEQRKAKVKRNLTILEEEIAEKGLNPGRCAQKVQELMNLDDRREEGFHLCVEYTDKLIEMGHNADSCVQWLIVCQVRYFHFIKDGEASVRQAEIVRKKYKMSHFAMLAIACIESEAIIVYGDFKAHLKLLKDDVIKYLSIYDHFKVHPDEQLVETQLDFPKFITPEKRNAMITYGAQACNWLEEYDEAYRFWKMVDFTKLENQQGYQIAFLQTLQHLSAPEPLKEYYLRYMNPAVFEPGNEKYVPKDLRDKMGVFVEPEENEPSDIDARITYFDSLPLDRFTETIRRLAKSAVTTGAFGDPFLSALLTAYEPTNGVEYFCLLFLMAESEIRRAAENGADGKAIDGLMTEYINAERQFYELLYLPTSFDIKTIQWLPQECRYNDILYRFVKNGKKDLQMVLEAAKLRPDMAKALSAWIGGMK